MDLFDIKGKKAIVTGGTRGLGNGIAEGFLEAGAQVCIIGSSDAGNTAVKKFTDKGYKCDFVKMDIGNREELKKGFEKCLSLLGGNLDILVNCAGIQRRHFCEEFPIEDWDAVINVNLNAVFMLCQLAGKQFIKQNSRGKIINLASMLTFFGGYTVPAYAASKGAVAQLTRALCNEWSSKGINVNAIAPGYMATEMNTALINDPGRSKEILARIPAHRWGTPDDMKGLAIFLASKASDYLDGAIIPVDGGYLSR